MGQEVQVRQVNLLLKGKAWPTAREVLLRMGYRGLVPDLVSYGSLINVSQWHDAWLLLTCLAGRRLGNLLLQNACLKAMRRSHWQIPLEILGHMRPDVVSFTLCMREQRWREAFRLWHLADPDVLGFNRMAACLQSRWEMAFSRLRTRCDMFLSGVERTFCFVFRVCLAVGVGPSCSRCSIWTQERWPLWHTRDILNDLSLS